MDFIIPQQDISELVAIATKICKKSTVPIMECVRIRFGKKGVAVESTNMDIWLALATSDFSAKVEATAIVPCHQLNSIISSIPKDKDITFTVTEKRLVVKTGSSKYQFGLLPEQEWPSIPWNEKSNKIVINSRIFAGAIKYVAGSTGVDLARYELNGVNIRSVKNKKALRLIASNGQLCSHIVFDAKDKADLRPEGFIFSKELVSLYSDLLSRADEDIDVALEITESKCRLEYEGDFRVSIMSKMIDGIFPNIDNLVPYDREDVANIIPKSAVLSALGRLNTLSSREKKFPIFIDFNGKNMKLSVKGEQGEAEEHFEVTHLRGADSSICISIPNLQIILSAFEGESITMRHGEFNEAVLLTEDENTVKPDAGNFSIVMPMRP